MTKEELFEQLREAEISEEQIALVADCLNDVNDDDLNALFEYLDKDAENEIAREVEEYYEFLVKVYIQEDFSVLKEDEDEFLLGLTRCEVEELKLDKEKWTALKSSITLENTEFCLIARLFFAAFEELELLNKGFEYPTLFYLSCLFAEEFLRRIGRNTEHIPDTVPFLLNTFFFGRALKYLTDEEILEGHKNIGDEVFKDTFGIPKPNSAVAKVNLLKGRTLLNSLRYYDELKEKLRNATANSSYEIKRICIEYMLNEGHISRYTKNEKREGNWKWWAVIQVWANANKSFAPDMGYDYTLESEEVSPKTLNAYDREWINKEFGEIYGEKDSSVIKTRLSRNPEWKKCFLAIDDEKDELVDLCTKLDRYLTEKSLKTIT